ncbi:hypothetical protein QTN25_001243 [Entamoeba marina]
MLGNTPNTISSFQSHQQLSQKQSRYTLFTRQQKVRIMNRFCNETPSLSKQQLLEWCLDTFGKSPTKRQLERIITGNFKQKVSRVKCTELDDVLFQWYQSTIDKGIVVTEKDLKIKANIRFSNGWIDNFKKRHGLKQKNKNSSILSNVVQYVESSVVDGHGNVIEQTGLDDEVIQESGIIPQNIESTDVRREFINDFSNQIANTIQNEKDSCWNDGDSKDLTSNEICKYVPFEKVDDYISAIEPITDYGTDDTSLLDANELSNVLTKTTKDTSKQIFHQHNCVN